MYILYKLVVMPRDRLGFLVLFWGVGQGLHDLAVYKSSPMNVLCEDDIYGHSEKPEKKYKTLKIGFSLFSFLFLFFEDFFTLYFDHTHSSPPLPQLTQLCLLFFKSTQSNLCCLYILGCVPFTGG